MKPKSTRNTFGEPYQRPGRPAHAKGAVHYLSHGKQDSILCTGNLCEMLLRQPDVDDQGRQ